MSSILEELMAKPLDVDYLDTKFRKSTRTIQILEVDGENVKTVQRRAVYEDGTEDNKTKFRTFNRKRLHLSATN